MCTRTCLLFVLMSLLLMSSGGCAMHHMYRGEQLPRDQVARLDIPRAQVLIDGETVDGRRFQTVELIPGRHIIEWDYAYPNGWTDPQKLVLHTEAGRSYRVNERFMAAPHRYGPFVEAGEFVAGTVIDTALLPFRVLFPNDETNLDGPPEGELYVWISEKQTSRIVAGYAPNVPQPHQPIMAIELDEELMR